MDTFDLIEGLLNNTVETEKVSNLIASQETGNEVYIVGKVRRLNNDISEVIEGYTEEGMAAVRVNELSGNNTNGNSTYGYKKINLIHRGNESNVNSELNVNVINASFNLSVKEIKQTIAAIESLLTKEEKQERQFDTIISKLRYESEMNDFRKLIDKYKYAQHYSEQHLIKHGGSVGKRNKQSEREEKELSKVGIFNYG
jgi:hypothetical protein